MRRIRIDPLRFLSDRSGVSAVEFALIAPILLVLVLGVAELGRYGMFRLEVSNAVYTIADLTSRAEVASETEIEEIIDLALVSLGSFSAPERTRVLASAVAHVGNGRDPVVRWQVSAGSMMSEASRIGAVGTGASVPAGLVSAEMGTAIVSEIMIDYDPWLLNFVLDHVIYETMAMRPRRAALAVLR